MGGNECGLDIDHNGPCRMETAGLQVDFWRCDVANSARVYLDAGANLIRFYPSGAPEGVGLELWTEKVMGKG